MIVKILIFVKENLRVTYLFDIESFDSLIIMKYPVVLNSSLVQNLHHFFTITTVQESFDKVTITQNITGSRGNLFVSYTRHFFNLKACRSAEGRMFG